jgi:hypothetical protein
MRRKLQRLAARHGAQESLRHPHSLPRPAGGLPQAGLEGLQRDMGVEMINQYGQKPEQISGRLLTFFGVWKVQSGYGTFPLSKELQTKPDPSAQAAWVSATVTRGEVTEYHFSEEKL